MTVRPAAQRRSPWLIPMVVAAAVVAVAAGVAVGFLVVPSGHGPTEPACQRPVAPLSVPTQPADKGGLVVAERGYSRDPEGDLSMGGIIANNARQAAYRTRVTFRALAANGSSAVPPDLAVLMYQEIPVILPGQRVAVGALADVPSDSASAVTRVEIELGGTRWVTPDPADPLFRPLTVELTDQTLATSISFGVTASGCPGLIERGVGMVFRDANGAIVGGSLNTGAWKGRCAGQGGPETVYAQYVPATADRTKTDISVYCDVADAPKDPAATPSPIN